MRHSLVFICAIALFTVSCTSSRSPGLHVDSSIAAEIRQIRAIDNHAHPLKVTGPGETDHDYDALPADALEDSPLPLPLRPGSPYFPEAWHALFGYRYSDATAAHLKELQRAKADIEKEKGDSFPVWVLNQTNTAIMLANRVSMGRGLPNDRFKWVPYADMFLLPLNNDAIKAQDPDHRAFVTNEELLLKSNLAGAGLELLPANLDDYLTFITHKLEEWKGSGAVAVKFEFAYLRDLHIGNPQRENAERVYSIYSRSSEPSPEEYKILQDYLFRYIAKESGRLNLPVHIHCAWGVGGYFALGNANPMALEPMFDDPALRKTKFVMLHGGWPFTREAALLISKQNVYLDFSLIEFLTYPAEEARAIRSYLEMAPEHVLYATDASPVDQNVGWPETAWIGSNKGRLALGLALTGMVDDDEITVDRAKEIAHMVLRDNARQLYRF
ncbi:MAG: amidohydrolase family protein [Bryobacteraceae bacterium]